MFLWDSTSVLCRGTQRSIVADHDHLDLPRRHTQTATDDAAPPADDTHRSRSGQIGANGDHPGLDGTGRQAPLPDQCQRSIFGFAIALLISTWSILSTGF